ncbi:MAG: imelysin family protein, partial [Geminicoccaceae bacterium]
LLALLALVAPSLPAAAQSYGELNATLVDEVVVPAYQRYAGAIGRLPASLEALCASPGQERLEAAQKVWREAMLAWQHAQPIGFGPVADQGLAPQIEFWPDKHGTAGRQFSQAMASRDGSLLDPAQLSDKSVGLTSLVSLERLLFGDAVLDTNGGDYACAYALAVARHQVDLAAALAEAWAGEGGFASVVTGADAGNDVFFSPYDPAAALYRSLADTLDGAIQVKLEPPMGDSLEAARGRLGENWRSGMELPSVAANLETARDLYATPGGFGDLFLALGGDAAVDQQVRAGFEKALQTAQGIPLPLALAVEDPAARDQVQQLVDQIKQLRELIRGPVVAALGLSIGFNATDGD